MLLRIIGTILFGLGMTVLIYFSCRKSKRDWEYMQESNRKHNEWMIEQGRQMERYEQSKRG